MSIAIFPLILLIVFCVVVVFGGTLLRRLLPSDHYLQKYLSDEAIESSLAWVMRKRNHIALGLLLGSFTVITLIYS